LSKAAWFSERCSWKKERKVSTHEKS